MIFITFKSPLSYTAAVDDHIVTTGVSQRTTADKAPALYIETDSDQRDIIENIGISFSVLLRDCASVAARLYISCCEIAYQLRVNTVLTLTKALKRETVSKLAAVALSVRSEKTLIT